MREAILRSVANVGSRVDFHTHILPQMDDGSQSVEESVQMLRTLAKANVSCVVLTPHFYPRRDNPEWFLERRDRAFAVLRKAVDETPDISHLHLIPGAEIEYFEGVACMGEYQGLKLGKAPCLLVEMPHGIWTSHMVDDLLQLNNRGTCRVVIAHVERYLFDQRKDVIHMLLQNGIVMQSNANFFIDRSTSRKAIRMLKKGWIHLLGSDCHGMMSRSPNIGDACEVIIKRAGEGVLGWMMHEAYNLLSADIHSIDDSVAVQV